MLFQVKIVCWPQCFLRFLKFRFNEASCIIRVGRVSKFYKETKTNSKKLLVAIQSCLLTELIELIQYTMYTVYRGVTNSLLVTCKL